MALTRRRSAVGDENREAGEEWRPKARPNTERDNQLLIKRTQQVPGPRKGREWPCCAHFGLGAGSQIRDPAPKLGADEVGVGGDDARRANPSPQPLADMLGRDWCHRGRKRSRCDANSSPSRTCNTILSVRLMVMVHRSGAI